MHSIRRGATLPQISSGLSLAKRSWMAVTAASTRFSFEAGHGCVISLKHNNGLCLSLIFILLLPFPVYYFLRRWVAP